MLVHGDARPTSHLRWLQRGRTALLQQLWEVTDLNSNLPPPYIREEWRKIEVVKEDAPSR
jgi:hypothetical protein